MYKTIKVEMLLTIDDKKWDDDDIEHSFDDHLKSMNGVLGVVHARQTGSIDISEDIEDTYDEYPLYDDDDLWNKFKKI